jgi:DNA repair protein RecN (Recombination protein N)
LGERADTTVIRSGCEEAYVEASFRLNEAMQAALKPLVEAEGLEPEQEDMLLLARELRLNGRNICRVNGRAVNLTLLREMGQSLVDIHGQGEHLSLLNPRSHLPLLDSYAGLVKERKELASVVGELRRVQRELQELRRDARLIMQQIDLLEFQVEDIDAANLKVGEEEELREERTRLANMEQITEHSAEALALLSGLDDDTPSVNDLMGQVERAMMHLVKADPSKSDLLERLQGLSYQINDAAGELQDYQDQLEFNPDRLNYLEERLELINRLKRKYGEDIPAVLARRDEAMAELDKISHSEERIEELEAKSEKLLRQIGRMGESISEKRKKAADILGEAIEKELMDLKMEAAQFKVGFNRRDDENGAYAGDARVAFDESGIDQAEFLVSANPGEDLKPMAKVASGGETARLMLALKTALAKVDSTPTLIFDEIDQGIGGRIGDVVGRKLWGLTNPTAHQVIVVTHLPQLAGYGDGHFNVSKQVVNGRTTTAVTGLDTHGRVQELAAMLGTEGIHARRGAESILRQAAKVKEEKGD